MLIRAVSVEQRRTKAAPTPNPCPLASEGQCWVSIGGRHIGSSKAIIRPQCLGYLQKVAQTGSWDERKGLLAAGQRCHLNPGHLLSCLIPPTFHVLRNAGANTGVPPPLHLMSRVSQVKFYLFPKSRFLSTPLCTCKGQPRRPW